jgi:lipoprotein-releasing system permease protein
MFKSSPRRDLYVGSILIVVGLAIAIASSVNPAKEGASFIRQHVWWLAPPAMALGFGGVIRAVWRLAMGEPWRLGVERSSVLLWLRRKHRSLTAWATAIFGLSFGVLTGISARFPRPRGSHVVIGHEILRLAALISGVALLLGLLTLILPLVLNLLEGRSFVSFVGARHVRATKSGFLTVISVLSIAGVSVSSCSLVSVVSIMGGFGQDLKRKILGNNAHIMIDTQDKNGFSDWQTVLAQARLVPGVAAATPVVAGEAMASSPSNTSGTLVRGIDPDSIGNVIDLVNNIEVGKFDYLINPDKLTQLGPDEVIGLGPGGEPFTKGPDLGAGSWFGGTADLDPSIRQVVRAPKTRPGIVVGRELAKTLHLYIGDEISLISPLGDLGPMGVLPRTRKFRVAAIFYSGMYEYDASHVYVMMDVAQELFSLNGTISAVEVKAVDGEKASDITPSVRAAISRQDLRVQDWRELNKNLFSALKLERIATFIILSIAIAVASFCIICTLLLMVTEKGKEIAILKALGASGASIMRIFVLEGAMIGAIGTAFGVATGVSFCLGLSWYGLRLDPDVYYIDRLPIAISWPDYGMVAICAMAICTIATLYPAHAASRLHPVQGLRYE